LSRLATARASLSRMLAAPAVAQEKRV
ncbi:RNA polymerase sigma factor, partial [Cronobacter dublinensis subsp. dublinensis]|nr:RNA polymerase sigma factor [Cronobacter dublinensis subsp. dublinensis]